MSTKQDQNALFNLDKLEISIRLVKFLPEIIAENKQINIGANISLEKTHQRTPIFKTVYNILIDGMEAAKLQCNANDNLLAVDHAVIRFNNEYLYSVHVPKYYKRIKNQLAATFLKIKTVDICADIEKDKKTDLFQYQYAAGKIDFKGSPTVTIQKKGTQIEYFRIGARKSDKFIRTYDKRKELSVSNKKYIERWWNENGLNQDKEIFRIELSLKGAIMHKIAALDFREVDKNQMPNNNYLPFLEETTIDILQNQYFLHDVFFSQTQKMLSYYKTNVVNKQGNKQRVSRRKHKHAFKFLKARSCVFFLYRIKDKATKVIHKIKMLTKFLTEISKETKNPLYEHLANSVVNFENMEAWRDKMRPRWLKDYDIRLKTNEYKKYVCKVADNMNKEISNFIFGRLPMDERSTYESYFDSKIIDFKI